jgi:transposase
MSLQKLLPGEGQLELDAIEIGSDALTLTVHATATDVKCPVCYGSSTYVHGVYLRKPLDLAWAGLVVHLHWRVRRFKCKNEQCRKLTFAEQIPEVIHPYARRTSRLADQQRHVAYIAGGEPGGQLMASLATPTSPDTLLRLIRSTPEEEPPTPRVLGVDDWAKKKGQTYGIILVDLERRHPVELLQDRTALTLATWLLAHPGVAIISRDRGNEMIKGSKDGAPDATQVADRWHLLKNLCEALERFLESKPASLKAAADESTEAPIGKEAGSQPMSVEVEAEPPVLAREDRQTKAAQGQQMRQENKRLRFKTVQTMHTEGYSQKEIARQLKIGVKTIRKYIMLETCPYYPEGRTRPSKMYPYRAYLEQQWQAGRHNATQLWREIKKEGFSGSRGLVAQWAALQRKQLPDKHTLLSKSVPKRVLPMAPRRAVWLLLRNLDELDTKEQAALQRMIKSDTQVDLAYSLGQMFFKLVRERQAEQLNTWIGKAIESKISALKSFAQGLMQDSEAVKIALSSEWSNGQTEGQVNRLKTLKRQMYGRANFDLLRKRVLGWRPP